MNEQQIQQLMQKLRELEKKYLENDLPPTALEIAGSRLDDVRFSTDNAGIDGDRKSTRLNSSHSDRSRMPSSA